MGKHVSRRARRAGALAITIAGVLVLAGEARGEVLQLRAEVHGGGAYGQGIGGAQKDDAFHAGASGGVYGFAVGAEVLFLDGWIEHDQYVTGDGLAGTWTQFMAGFDLDFELGSASAGTTIDQYGQPTGADPWVPWYGEFGLAVGFGVGTGQQIELPLDNGEVSDKGVLAQAKLGFGYRFTRILSVGVSVPVQAGYLFKSGVANDLDNHYQSVQGAALLNMRLSFTLK